MATWTPGTYEELEATDYHNERTTGKLWEGFQGREREQAIRTAEERIWLYLGADLTHPDDIDTDSMYREDYAVYEQALHELTQVPASVEGTWGGYKHGQDDPFPESGRLCDRALQWLGDDVGSREITRG